MTLTSAASAHGVGVDLWCARLGCRSRAVRPVPPKAARGRSLPAWSHRLERVLLCPFCLSPKACLRGNKVGFIDKYLGTELRSDGVTWGLRSVGGHPPERTVRPLPSTTTVRASPDERPRLFSSGAWL